MRRRRGMDHEALRVADVREVRQELHGLDEPDARGGAAANAERQDAARAARQVAPRERFVPVARERRVADPLDGRMRGQVARDGERGLAVAGHPQVQRLDPLQQQERGMRRERRPQRAHRLHARLHREPEVAERLEEAHAVIAAGRLGHLRELAVVPREPAGFDDDAAHRRPVPAQVLRDGVDDDVGAVLERAAQPRRRQRVVDDQRNARRVRDLRDRGQVRDVELRVAERLDVERLRLGPDRRREVARIVAVDERRLDAELRERDGELRIGPAVERPRSDDVVAGAAQREQRDRLRRHAGRRRERRAAALERGDALLERRHRRVGDARVHVAERLQVEQARRVVGAVEDERRRLVDRQRARAGGRVGDLPGVEAQRVEAEFAVRH